MAIMEAWSRQNWSRRLDLTSRVFIQSSIISHLGLGKQRQKSFFLNKQKKWDYWNTSLCEMEIVGGAFLAAAQLGSVCISKKLIVLPFRHEMLFLIYDIKPDSQNPCYQ